MSSNASEASGQLFTVAFTVCATATTVAITIRLSDLEEDRLRALLGHLQDYGLILAPAFSASLGALGLDHAIEAAASAVGQHFVEAALAAGAWAGLGGDPHPVAVMPVWAFGPEGDSLDVLVSSARLWGVDLFVEALRLQEDDSGHPVATVQERHARWLAAAGAGRPVRSVRPPGRRGSYAVFAACAPQ